MTTMTDKIPAATLGPPDERCGECYATLATDQRYCLHCGHRRGGPRVDVLALSELRAGPAAPRRKRLAISRRLATAALAAAALSGVAFGAAIDSGESSRQVSDKPPSRASEPAPAGSGNAAQDAEDAQKRSESLPDSLVTK